MKFYHRIGLLVLAFLVWHGTQTFLTYDIESNGQIIDRLHSSKFFSAINSFMKENIDFTNYNLILTSALIDINVIFICLKFLSGNNFKSVFLLFSGLILRQLCQFINRLPTPENMIWFHPSVSSMLVTYYVHNDFFFSGHTYVALCAGLEIMSAKNIFAKMYALFFIVYEIMLIISINGHYFMDIYGAFATYFMLCYFYDRAFSSKA